MLNKTRSTPVQSGRDDVNAADRCWCRRLGIQLAGPRWAVVEAGRHGAELLALTTWTALPPPIVSPYVDVTKAVDRQDGTSAAEQALQTVVRTQWPATLQSSVEMVATEGHPTNFWQSSPGMLISSSWVLGGGAA